MRLEPEDELMLKAELTMLRFLCNWMWPAMFLFTATFDLFRIFVWEEYDLFHFVWGVIWYSIGVRWWKNDVRRLREKREKWAAL